MTVIILHTVRFNCVMIKYFIHLLEDLKMIFKNY